MTYYNRGEVLSPFAEKVESLHSRSKGTSPEDEIFTWLQYPLDCTHERGYCTELFERLASSLGKKVELDSDQGVPVSMENPGRRGLSGGSENAKDALALGAGRASGTVLPEGAETFNKVKTIMQQAPCLHSNTSQQETPSVGMRYENCEPFHTSVQPHGFLNTNLLADGYPAYGAMHNFRTSYLWSASVSPSVPTQGMERLQLSEDAAAGSTLCETSHFFTSDGTGRSLDVHAQIKHTEGSSYSLVTEDRSRAASMQAASAGHWEPVGSTAPYDAATSFRLSPPRKDREWLERCNNMRADVPDGVPSCSGGSQTSAELSSKETSSHRKQKVDDCQSKNAEVDSAEVSQPHRRLSKRSRVAESHNLSEKRRRNRINEKLKTLQELIPNSSKTDKASILDEAIEYLKALQSQLQMMSSRTGMKLPPMSFPLGMPHMQMAHSMGLGFPLVHAGMGMGLMDLPRGMDGRPFQAFAAASPHFNLAYPAIAPLPSQTCNQPYLAMEARSSEILWPLQHLPAQAYNPIYVESQTVSSAEQGERLSTPRVPKDS